MGEPLQSSIQDSKDDTKAYLDWLLDTINQYASQIRRTTLLALFLMAVFTIVSQSGDKINLKGINVSAGSLVDIFIPALVAYLFLQLVTDTNRLITLYRTFSEKFGIWANQSRLRVSYSLVMPPFPLAWGASMTVQNHPSNFPDRAHRFLVKHTDKATPFIGIIFLIFAYYALLAPSWGKKGLSRLTLAAIAVSSAISLTCVIFSVIAYFRPSDP